jgi:hypothetical protein
MELSITLDGAEGFNGISHLTSEIKVTDDLAVSKQVHHA